MAVDNYDPNDFQQVENRLHAVAQRIREIRKGLQDGPLANVRLNFGTFVHYVGELEKLAEKHLGEYRAQFTAAQAAATREKVKADRAKKTERFLRTHCKFSEKCVHFPNKPPAGREGENMRKKYVLLRDSVVECVEHYRGHQMASGCVKLVNIEFLLPSGSVWRGDMPEDVVFESRESAEKEWVRKFGTLTG